MTAPFRPSPWPRLAVVAGLQLPSVALVALAPAPTALWVAGLWGSVVCAGGTDSGWRWLNRMLVLVAAGWLLVPLIFAW